MSRTLRSRTRSKKLQIHHINRVNRALSVNIYNCTETTIERFEQREFLCLFGLIPNKHQIGSKFHMENGTTTKAVNSKEPVETQSLEVSSGNANCFRTRSKRTLVLEKQVDAELYIQGVLKENRLAILDDLSGALAERRKQDKLYEKHLQTNIEFKISIEVLHRNVARLQSTE